MLLSPFLEGVEKKARLQMGKALPSPMRSYLVICMGTAAASVFLCGCNAGRGPERVVVSGSVTYHGKPIPDGTVRFLPDSKSATPVSVAIVKDGKYRADGAGGVAVGLHKIEIEAFRPASGTFSPMVRSVPQTQYLPRQFNVDSKLKIEIVSGGKEIVKDFELTD